MNDRITLTMQDILEKEFKIDARGYRPQEVDKFLDIIIKDYNEYNNIIRNLEKEKRALALDFCCLLLSCFFSNIKIS